MVFMSSRGQRGPAKLNKIPLFWVLYTTSSASNETTRESRVERLFAQHRMIHGSGLTCEAHYIMLSETEML